MLKELAVRLLGNNNARLLHAYFRSNPEKELIRKRKAFYAQFLSSGDTYYDVGANYGNRIEPVMDMGVKVVAIEPQKECLSFLKRKYGNKIALVPYGLGEKEEEKTIYISNVHTISSFSKDWIEATQNSGRFSQYTWDKQRKVPMTTLDNLIRNYGKPRFMKIDVEGFELEVLKGLSVPVHMISFEYTVPERTEAAAACIRRLVDISGDAVMFNYSVGESMEWAMNRWISSEEMLVEIAKEAFISTGFGDIYAKSENA